MAHIPTDPDITEIKSAVAEIICAFKCMQLKVRCATEICGWLDAHAELLRRVCMELNHCCPDLHYEHPATIHVTMHPIDCVSPSDDELPYTGQLPVYYLADTDCTYAADPTIDLGLVFSSIPELGVALDYKAHGSRYPVNTIEVAFSPVYWPFAGGTLLFHVSHTEEEDALFLRALLRALYPASAFEAFATLYDANMFDTEADVCEWLLANERKINVEVADLVTPANLAI